MEEQVSSDIISHYFPSLSLRQAQQFSELGQLYRDWNEKINVISRKDIDQLYLRHVLHSLGIAKVVNLNVGTELLDVGTGGGFPGIPLAILFPDCHFHLVDSIGKKVKVVREVAGTLGLQNVSPEQTRAEQLTGKYDFIISRAVTRMKTFNLWVKNRTHTKQRNSLKNGILYLKGGDLTEEIKEAGKTCRLFPLSDYFEEDFFESKYVVHLAL